jgi:hypothetical protein
LPRSSPKRVRPGSAPSGRGQAAAQKRAHEAVAAAARLANRRSWSLARVNDLSRSRVPLDQDPTLICVVELSRSSWLVAGMIPGVERRPLKSWSLIVDGYAGDRGVAQGSGFESTFLQRRVGCEPAANRPRRGHAAGSNTFQCRAATGPVLRDRIAVAPADCTQGVSAKANFGLWV